ncbi:hypothetical protein CKAN_00673700 [Cinnamomum micranthum f. kanehirae]|uniref:Uncharacterized protein n=1 Tax=Cinnamomum micranthum f. kanehirae TaxID=337451 RepID=A0A3S3NZC5_9MAGN|nr:hypothetical protein CKAN_00673700 [Cinnamomum micranthum f. kanehirae]
MDGPQLIAKVIAVCILVVTMIVNIGTQMGTGVIYAFFPEHAIVMFLMLALLLILCSTAVMVPAARELVEEKNIEISMSYGDEVLYNLKLRESVMKHCLMAVTGNGQYAVGRSAICTASGAFCLLSALILGQAAVRSLIISDWAGSLQDRKSTTGYMFNIGCGVVCLLTKKQETIALSSAEAEYVAATSATCQAVRMRRIFEDLHQSQSGFQRVVEFDSNKVPLLGSETSPPNCWALPIVILTQIAKAIAPPDKEKDVELLPSGIHESLKYVRLIEANLDGKRLINMR